MKKKVLAFIAAVILSTVVLAALYWLSHIIINKEYAFSWWYVWSAMITSIILLPLNLWFDKRFNRKK